MIAFAIIVLAAQSSNSDQRDGLLLLQQLGYIAGQAVACGIEEPDVAARVAIAIADKVGSGDEANHRIVADFAARAAARPCAIPTDGLSEARAKWSAMRKRAGVD